MLTDDFTIILRLLFVQQHKKNVYQNIKSTFMKRWYQLLYVKWGGPRARGGLPRSIQVMCLYEMFFLKECILVGYKNSYLFLFNFRFYTFQGC